MYFSVTCKTRSDRGMYLIIRFFTSRFVSRFGVFALSVLDITVERLSGPNLRCKITNCYAIEVKGIISLICKSIETEVS